LLLYFIYTYNGENNAADSKSEDKQRAGEDHVIAMMRVAQKLLCGNPRNFPSID
jgi:hypothetical protein